MYYSVLLFLPQYHHKPFLGSNGPSEICIFFVIDV